MSEVLSRTILYTENEEDGFSAKIRSYVKEPHTDAFVFVEHTRVVRTGDGSVYLVEHKNESLLRPIAGIYVGERLRMLSAQTHFLRAEWFALLDTIELKTGLSKIGWG